MSGSVSGRPLVVKIRRRAASFSAFPPRPYTAGSGVHCKRYDTIKRRETS